MGVYIDNIDTAVAAKQVALEEAIHSMVVFVLGISLLLAVLSVVAGVWDHAPLPIPSGASPWTSPELPRVFPAVI